MTRSLNYRGNFRSYVAGYANYQHMLKKLQLSHAVAVLLRQEYTANFNERTAPTHVKRGKNQLRVSACCYRLS